MIVDPGSLSSRSSSLASERVDEVLAEALSIGLGHVLRRVFEEDRVIPGLGVFRLVPIGPGATKATPVKNTWRSSRGVTSNVGQRSVPNVPRPPLRPASQCSARKIAGSTVMKASVVPAQRIGRSGGRNT